MQYEITTSIVIISKHHFLRFLLSSFTPIMGHLFFFFSDDESTVAEIWGSIIVFCGLSTCGLFFLFGLLGSLRLIHHNWKWIFLCIGLMLYGAISSFICLAPLAICAAATSQLFEGGMQPFEFFTFCAIVVVVMTFFAFGRKSIMRYL